MDCKTLLSQAQESLTNEEFKTLSHLMNKAHIRYEYKAVCKDIDSREFALPTKLLEKKVQLEAKILKYAL
jgi:hypothetical protein